MDRPVPPAATTADEWTALRRAAPRPPFRLASGTWVISRRADVHQVLADPCFVVPPVASRPEPTAMDLFRQAVARFASGAAHARRRALVEDDARRLDPVRLRAASGEMTRAALDRAAPGTDLIRSVAQVVPVGVLAAALGLSEGSLPMVVDAVGSIAAAYQPGAPPAAEEAARTALAEVSAYFDVADAERTANRIGLLVQAYDATAGLIGNAAYRALRDQDADGPVATPAAVDQLLAETVRDDPPVWSTRRLSLEDATVGGQLVPAGSEAMLHLAAAGLAFGDGAHACPGREHALALAAGALEVLLGRCGLVEPDAAYLTTANRHVVAALPVRVS